MVLRKKALRNLRNISAKPSASASSTENPAISGHPVNLRALAAESRFRNETRNLHRDERDRYSSFLWNMMRLDMGPRISLEELVGARQDRPLEPSQEGSLNTTLDFYHGKDNQPQLVQVLKFFTAYLLQQARKATDFRHQLFLMFKTIDLARMVSQYASNGINADAESIVFGILTDLNDQRKGQYTRYFLPEQEIYTISRRIQTLPNDLELRYQLGELLLRQTSYFDALIQFQLVLRLYPRRGGQSDRIHGLVFARMGDVFYDTAGRGELPLQDGRKLRVFAERYNRDFAPKGQEFPTLESAAPSQVTALRNALKQEATRWWMRAVEIPSLKPTSRIQMARDIAQFHVDQGNHEEASKVLERTYSLWRVMPKDRSTLEMKFGFLQLLAKSAALAKRTEPEAWASRELLDLEKPLNLMRAEEKERLSRRAAMLSPEGTT